jgi:hypothetical protein
VSGRIGAWLALAMTSCGSSGADGGLATDAIADGPPADAPVDAARDATPDAGFVPLGCAPEAPVGTFRVDLAATYTGVQGQVFDGVRPGAVFDTVAISGDCRLARPPSYECDPPCGVGTSCGETGACVPNPAAHSVGAVTVTGLAVPLVMNPLGPMQFYTNPSPLPHPGYTPGADLGLSAEGGDSEAFELHAFGVSALEVTAPEFVVESGAPSDITWTAPPAGPTHLRMLLTVNPHGSGPGSVIECEVPDTGAHTIPEPLVTALVADGLSGFPRITLTRVSADSVDITLGCVEFRSQSQIIAPVSVPGLESCTGDEDCTPPDTCQTDLTCA